MQQNRSAAASRKSAIAERIRLREEWSELKGDDTRANKLKQPKLLVKKNGNNVKSNKKYKPVHNMQTSRCLRAINESINECEQVSATSDVLRGIVALVDVGSECRALALRAALAALGATVMSSWSPLVTHVIWSQGGSRDTRAKARALASRLVSPLWVEGCAAAARRLPELSFPAQSRPSDLPSPRTLKQLLKKADMENIILADLMSDSNEGQNANQLRLRISTESERDTSKEVSADKYRDTTADEPDIETRVNTAPRRTPFIATLANHQLPKKKSRRKLFTHKEAEVIGGSSGDDSDEDVRAKPAALQRKASQMKLTQRERLDLAQAERMAKKILAAYSGKTNPRRGAVTLKTPRIVLTGMNHVERQTVLDAVRSLNGRVQSKVNKRTTHVLLGSCQEAAPNGHRAADITGLTGHVSNLDPSGSALRKPRTVNALEGAARGCRVLHGSWAVDSCLRGQWLHHAGYEVHHLRRICQKARVERAALGLKRSEYACDVFNGLRILVKSDAEQRHAAVHLLALCGARVTGDKLNDVTVQNASMRSATVQNARGRSARGRNASTRNVKIRSAGARSDVTVQNASVRSATVQNARDRSARGRNAGTSSDVTVQNGGSTADFDITIGLSPGEIGSKWVFDSVAAGRIRTTRRYVNKHV